MKSEQLLSPKQVSEKLQIHYRKVLDFIIMGELKAYKSEPFTELSLASCLSSYKRKSISHIGKVDYRFYYDELMILVLLFFICDEYIFST